MTLGAGYVLFTVLVAIGAFVIVKFVPDDEQPSPTLSLLTYKEVQK